MPMEQHWITENLMSAGGVKVLDETSATSLDNDLVINENKFYISTKELRIFSFFENVNSDTRLKTVVILLKIKTRS